MAVWPHVLVTAPPVCLDLGKQRWVVVVLVLRQLRALQEGIGREMVWGCCKSRELGRILEELKRFANKKGA